MTVIRVSDDSDVYMIQDVSYPKDRPYHCYCEHEDGMSWQTAILHLADHLRAGDNVPNRAFAQLMQDRGGRS